MDLGLLTSVVATVVTQLSWIGSITNTRILVYASIASLEEERGLHLCPLNVVCMRQVGNEKGRAGRCITVYVR